LPVDPLSGTVGVIWDGKPSDAWPMFAAIGADENFLKVFQVHLLAGRWFSPAFGADSLNYVINERSLHLMGFNAENAIGRSLSVWGNKGTIIGVVKDFNFKPVQQSIEPLVMLGRNIKIGYLVARSKTGHTAEAIAALKGIWEKFNPSYEFEYGFLDQDLANRYTSEKRMGILFNIAAILAILISCLGLAGLAIFTTERRIKEIGIRKTLGASVSGIVFMLSKDFLRLVLMAIIIASPIAYYFMDRWLQNFAYRVEIHWWIFIMAGFAAVCITMITVGFQTIKAGLANPVNSLKAE
jgi:ABC-type antimicrobial peptide transport system permease subunit